MPLTRFSRRDFFYRLGALSAVSLLPRASADEAPFTFVQLCDTQLGMGGYDHDVACFRKAVTAINALQPDFVVICGDLVNDAASDAAYGDFNAIEAGFTMPCHCVPGNHDVGNSPTPASLERYRRIVGKDYFSFEHKGYVFALVNTQLWKGPLEGESEKHDAWLRGVLTAAKAEGKPVVIAGHSPLFLETPDEKEAYFNLPESKRAELLALFEANGVAAVVTGHTHKHVVAEYHGIQMVSSATTSKNFDGAPMGFRLWRVASVRPARHEYLALPE